MNTVTASFEPDVAAIGKGLAASFGRLLGGLPGGMLGPQRLAEVVGIDKGLASRLLKAIRSRDPIAVVHVIPGPDPLRRFLRAAAERGAPADLVREAGVSVDRFAAFVAKSAGNRSAFNGVVAHLLPEAREQFESRARQRLFSGFSQIKGFSVDVDFTATFIRPSQTPGFVDYAVLSGMLGLRRQRPDAVVRLATHMIRDTQQPWTLTTLDGTPIEDSIAGRLDQFCSAPPAEVKVETIGNARYYFLAGQAFGPDSTVDLVLGHSSRTPAPDLPAPGERRFSGMGVEADKPIKLLHFDVFIHDSIYRDMEPQLFIYDTAFRGMANMNDPSRVPDRLNLQEQIVPLGRGFERIRASHIQMYVEMLQYLVANRGWEPREFRAYRYVASYPIYGTQLSIGFA
ncbi:MAG: hypothetical protein LC135_02955 [Phycisphaerae bacterium]|nr:hypothetical protein [Phycisphaerae bacterium]MCZ2398814.1 hypothetical protein [Phycisphaerae bacterium]